MIRIQIREKHRLSANFFKHPYQALFNCEHFLSSVPEFSIVLQEVPVMKTVF